MQVLCIECMDLPVSVCEDLAPNVLCHNCPALQVHVHRGDSCALCTLQLLLCHALGCSLQSKSRKFYVDTSSCAIALPM